MAHTPLVTPYTTCTHTCARRADTHTTYIHTQSPYRADRAVPLLPLGLLVQFRAAEVEDSWALVTAEHLPSLVTHPAVGVIFSSVTTAAHYLTAMEIWQTEAKEEMVSNLLTPHHKQTHTHTHTHTFLLLHAYSLVSIAAGEVTRGAAHNVQVWTQAMNTLTQPGASPA